MTMRKIVLWITQLRIEHLWVLVVLVGIFAFVNTHPIRPNDFWFHLAIGREIVQTGAIPQVDTYSYTQYGSPYLSNNTFWLMQVALYGVYNLGGPAWVILLTSLTITLAYILLVWTGYQLSGNWRAAAMGGLFAMLLGVDNWNVRPQVMAYLCAAVCLALIMAYRRGTRKAWHLAAYPAVMLLWVNSHGTFFFGLALLLFWGVEAGIQIIAHKKHAGEWQFQPLLAPLILGLVSGMVTLCNPLGLGIIKYLTSMSTSPVIQELILEWQPPDYSTLSGVLFLLALIFAGILKILSRTPLYRKFTANSYSLQKSHWVEGINFFYLFCYLFFAFLALRYSRAIVWFGIFLSPAVAEGMGRLLKRFQRRPVNVSAHTHKINIALLTLLALMALFSLPWFKPWWPVLPEKKGLLAYDTPVEATQFMLDRKLPAPVFHDVAFGSYFDWAAVPEYRVFVDPRFELYTEAIWQEYMAISYASPDWQSRLDRFGIQTLVLHHKNQAWLISAVRTSPDWAEVYEDDAAVIFTRQPGQ